MLQFNHSEIAGLVSSFGREERLAFALSCCERLYPNYVVFSHEQRWGDAGALRSALDLAWCVLTTQQFPSPDLVRQALDSVVDAEPETEDFTTALVSSALDAANAIGMMLRLLQTDDPSLVVEIASLCRDTVDMYLQSVEPFERSAADFEERLRSHRMMQAELRRQHDDLVLLAASPWSTAQAAGLEKAWRDPPTSNIGLHV